MLSIAISTIELLLMSIKLLLLTVMVWPLCSCTFPNAADRLSIVKLLPSSSQIAPTTWKDELPVFTEILLVPRTVKSPPTIPFRLPFTTTRLPLRSRIRSSDTSIDVVPSTLTAPLNKTLLAPEIFKPDKMERELPKRTVPTSPSILSIPIKVPSSKTLMSPEFSSPIIFKLNASPSGTSSSRLLS